MHIFVAFFVVLLVFAAVPALIAFFVVRFTENENTLNAYRKETGDVYSAHLKSLNAPHILARTPYILLLPLLAISGVTAWCGLSSFIEGYLDLRTFEALFHGTLIFILALVAILLKHKEIKSARLFEKSKQT